MNVIHWKDTLRAPGNGHSKPFVMQMLSAKGWLLEKKVAGNPVLVRYDRSYVVYKLYKEFVEAYAATTLSDEEVLESAEQLLLDAMRLRNPDFTPASPVTNEDIPVVAEVLAPVVTEVNAGKKR